jgi:enoyl-CoA hydratase/carnithine racemase
MSGGERIGLSIEGALATLRLIRPEKRNAIDEAFLDAFDDAVQAVAADPRVTVMLLEAEGPGFCAGFDLDVLKQFDSDEERTRQFAPIMGARLRQLAYTLDRLWNMEPVTIASVQGAAAGGGFSLALACDLRVMASDARCWYPEVSLGSALTPASTRLLTRLVPAGIAKDIILSCRRLDAPELLSLGIANRIAESDALSSTTRAYADELLARPANALLTSKATVNALVSGQAVLRTDLIRSRE